MIIDQDKCVASGQCVLNAEDAFDQRDEDGAMLLHENRVLCQYSCTVVDLRFILAPRVLPSAVSDLQEPGRTEHRDIGLLLGGPRRGLVGQLSADRDQHGRGRLGPARRAAHGVHRCVDPPAVRRRSGGAATAVPG